MSFIINILKTMNFYLDNQEEYYSVVLHNDDYYINFAINKNNENDTNKNINNIQNKKNNKKNNRKNNKKISN